MLLSIRWNMSMGNHYVLAHVGKVEKYLISKKRFYDQIILKYFIQKNMMELESNVDQLHFDINLQRDFGGKGL
jgi:hypothetical protein